MTAVLTMPAKSDFELRALRTQLIEEYGVGEINFTCDDCPAKRVCQFAFDLYNTDGDCLAEK